MSYVQPPDNPFVVAAAEALAKAVDHRIHISVIPDAWSDADAEAFTKFTTTMLEHWPDTARLARERLVR